MKLPSACYFLLLFLAIALGTRQSYEELERKLKQISSEKSSLLQQLSKSGTESHGMKGNLQNLKADEAVAKNDVQKLLEISQKQTDEMKSLQETLQKQITEAAVKAEKQQAGINFLKAEVERKSKLIRDLQQEAQQLTDLERKLLAAKQELEKTAGDKESQLKALKEVAQLCVSGVLKNQPPFIGMNPPRTTENGMLSSKNSSRHPFHQANRKLPDISPIENTSSPSKGVFPNVAMKSDDQDLMDCSSHNEKDYESSRLRSRSQKPEQNEKKIRDCGY
ncbi:leucine zipper protein 2 isoform X3 [Hemiscyllium ocellatum]|uniref:leucine zipper protein 2 isoform X3 n=1 Tax=Hemiscyllium ocellatum TaxID=170820 RepID=UPI00296642F9|nr:leucine zipper protein 2 isoform X3 [Hemiscyllium ocellatum]